MELWKFYVFETSRQNGPPGESAAQVGRPENSRAMAKEPGAAPARASWMSQQDLGDGDAQGDSQSPPLRLRVGTVWFPASPPPPQPSTRFHLPGFVQGALEIAHLKILP